jgi:Uma2 family endonuclease
VNSKGLFTYPDIVVFCGEPQFADTRRDTITDATVIIEILSPSTENYDRGFKFEQYRQVPSLKDYIVISQNRVHVEHWNRQHDGAWMLFCETSDVNATVNIPSIECSFRVSEAYERVELAGMTGSET